MKIDLTLQANFWNRSPSIIVKLDNKIIKEFNNFVAKQKTNITFDAELEDGEHQLVIERINKTTKDTIIEDNKIVKDSTVEIIDVMIDKFE